jgi:hypothetical protein
VSEKAALPYQGTAWVGRSKADFKQPGEPQGWQWPSGTLCVCMSQDFTKDWTKLNPDGFANRD